RPVHRLRKSLTTSPFKGRPPKLAPAGPQILAALAAAGRRRISRSGSSRSRRRATLIILPVIDVSVHHAVIVPVGPDRAGETADRSADHRALEDADARDDRAGGSAESRAAESARGRAAKHAAGVGIIA